MTTPSRLLIYKASAGSGKTFTLAATYVSLVLLNPAEYRHILAVTFTNKATGEMKERILNYLNGIANNDPAAEDCLDKAMELMKEAGAFEDIEHKALTKENLRKNARKALSNILHNYSFFRVETIDSFMLGILRNLAKELDLGNNMDIELDAKKTTANAVHDLVKDLTLDSPVMDSILEYIRTSIEEERAWNVTSKLTSFARHLHTEGYLRHSEVLEDLLDNDRECIARLRQTYQKRLRLAEEAAQESATRFFGIVDSLHISVDDFNGKSRSPYSFFDKIKKGELPNITATLSSYADGSKGWANAHSPSRASIEGAENDLCAILTAAISRVEELKKAKSNAIAVTANLYQLQLIGAIDKKMRETCRKDNRFLLADTCLMLKRMATGNSDTSFIYEKTGNEINHILIDEFQDTSGLQWDNFLPLLSENVSRGQQDLIVGDVKQAIYRWRDSNADIMGQQVERDMDIAHPKTIPLKMNRRSLDEVVRFNGRFFNNIIRMLETGTFDDTCDTSDITAYYADVVQDVNPNKTGGFVNIINVDVPETITPQGTTKKPSKAESDEAMCCATAEQVVKLLDAGLKQSDIAILTRENKEIALIANWFNTHPDELGGHNISIISGEAFKLEASDIVSMFILALRYIAQPTDTISLVTLAADWHRFILCDDLQLPEILALPEGRYGLPDALFDERDALAEMPLCELLYKLYEILDMQRMTGQDAWLQTFFDQARSFAADTAGGTTEFLTEWDETIHSKAIPSGNADGITALTIHKSKGLEFHTVIVPFCEWKFEKFSGGTIWVDTNPNDFEGIPCLPVNHSKEMKESQFAAEYREETKQQWLDNLNLLYVAFTRPECNLIVLRSKTETSNPPSDVAAFIDYGLGLDLPETSSQPAPPYEKKMPRARLDLSIGSLVTTRKDDSPATSEDITSQFHASRPTMPFRQSNESRTYINRGDDSDLSEFITRGNILHEVFSHISTAADAQPVIDSLFRAGIIDADRRTEVEDIISEALIQPEAADWFSGRYALLNECTILTVNANDGSMDTPRPDRIMLAPDRTIVVDFKSGQYKKAHERQVRHYMQLLSDMGYPNVEGYLWYILEHKTIKL